MDRDDDLKKLSKILDEEIYMFRELLKIEKLKNSIIIQQDVEKLKEVTEVEEKYIEQISEKENLREKVVSKLFEKYNINDKKVFTSLLKRLPNDESDIKNDLKLKKDELAKSIKDLKAISTLNNRLLADTIKFFNYTVNSLKSINNITYSRNNNELGRGAHLVDHKV